ncbi:MAG: hypothetical protein WCF65_07335 [Parachlamydiaceae bacterium]
MENKTVNWSAVEAVVESIIEQQNRALLKLGRRIVPTLTSEDVLQPNDYPELENHPEFRHEEGILAGALTVQAALRAIKWQYSMAEGVD